MKQGFCLLLFSKKPNLFLLEMEAAHHLFPHHAGTVPVPNGQGFTSITHTGLRKENPSFGQQDWMRLCILFPALHPRL